ncbi:MAG: hypothetical protein LCH37_12130 [Bacteroidetes bacterium]|nr:hypothetical protein [Bacteroidota bacterium]
MKNLFLVLFSLWATTLISQVPADYPIRVKSKVEFEKIIQANSVPVYCAKSSSTLHKTLRWRNYEQQNKENYCLVFIESNDAWAKKEDTKVYFKGKSLGSAERMAVMPNNWIGAIEYCIGKAKLRELGIDSYSFNKPLSLATLLKVEEIISQMGGRSNESYFFNEYFARFPFNHQTDSALSSIYYYYLFNKSADFQFPVNEINASTMKFLNSRKPNADISFLLPILQLAYTKSLLNKSTEYSENWNSLTTWNNNADSFLYATQYQLDCLSNPGKYGPWDEDSITSRDTSDYDTPFVDSVALAEESEFDGYVSSELDINFDTLKAKELLTRNSQHLSTSVLVALLVHDDEIHRKLGTEFLNLLVRESKELFSPSDAALKDLYLTLNSSSKSDSTEFIRRMINLPNQEHLPVVFKKFIAEAKREY